MIDQRPGFGDVFQRPLSPLDGCCLSEGHPHTADGRYFVVRGRLWRLANPALSPEIPGALVHELMAARRAVRGAQGEAEAVAAARARVDAAKRALGERGPVWWEDGAPDYNRRMAAKTPYADWYASQAASPARPAARRTTESGG